MRKSKNGRVTRFAPFLACCVRRTLVPEERKELRNGSFLTDVQAFLMISKSDLLLRISDLSNDKSLVRSIISLISFDEIENS